MTKKGCHPKLKPFIPVVRTLGATLGPEYEILLHDVSGGGHAIVAMEHAELTGRDPESPLSAFGHFLLHEEECRDVEYIVNYESSTPDGRSMRSSVTLIRDDDGSVIGFLCINYDTTRARMLRDWAEALIKVEPLPFTAAKPERFVARHEDLLHEMLDEVRTLFPKPLRFLSRQERVTVIRRLEEMGFFGLKGAVEVLCRETGKSRFTIYGDLRDKRQERETD